MRFVLWLVNVKVFRNLTAFILAVGTFSCHAMLVFSQATSSVYAGVCPLDAALHGMGSRSDGWATNRVPIMFDEKLMAMFFCNTGNIPVLVPCNESVFVKFTLHDQLGGEIDKTSEGSLWGNDIRHFPKKPGIKTFDRMSGHRAVAGPDSEHFQGWPGGIPLPAPDDLFEIKKSGIYYLTLEVHLMKQRILGPNSWTWDPIALPPITVTIIRPK